MGSSAPTQGWRIRPFDLRDYDAVYALWRDAGAGVSLRPSDRREEIEKKLARDPDLFLVAEADGQVVGVILGAWDGRRGWLHHLAVSQAHRQRGIATALIRAVEAGLRAKGCLKVNLLVSRTNQAAGQSHTRNLPVISPTKRRKTWCQTERTSHNRLPKSLELRLLPQMLRVCNCPDQAALGLYASLGYDEMDAFVPMGKEL